MEELQYYFVFCVHCFILTAIVNLVDMKWPYKASGIKGIIRNFLIVALIYAPISLALYYLGFSPY